MKTTNAHKTDPSSFMIGGGQQSGSLSYGKKMYKSKQNFVPKPFSPGADLVNGENDQDSMDPGDFAEFDN